MKYHKKRYWMLIISLLFLFAFFIQSASAGNIISVEYFYNSNCGSCRETKKIIEAVNESFKQNETMQLYWDIVVFKIKEYKDPRYEEEYEYYSEKYGIAWPFALIQNETNITIIQKFDISESYINELIQLYLEGYEAEQKDLDEMELDFLIWKIRIDRKDFSLPILTIIVGAADSFNPCAFFILIFLMNLLIHVRSRKRMMLIGTIFVFFSGLIYFIFMVILLNVLKLANEQITILSLIVGSVALVIGLLNIKDFFYYKKGVSLSIPESKKPSIYKKMRKLVKTTYLPAVLVGTIFLAISVNIYELICSAILPVYYITALKSTYPTYSPLFYQYILFYNIVYVIPLIVIMFIFIFTLGRRQITDWQGRILKLFSGIVIGSFGAILLIDHQLLSNIAIPILILLASLLSTYIISSTWKKSFLKKVNKKEEKEL